MSTIINGTTDAITFPDGTIQSTSALVSGKVPYSTLPAGSVLQVVQVVKTDTTVQSGTSFASISGLSASITPKNSANKVLVMFTVYLGSDVGSNVDGGLALYKNGSIVTGSLGDSSGSRISATASANTRSQYEMACNQATYLDSPATTSATTYAVYGRAGTGSLYVNREVTDGNDAGSYRVISTLTLMEIAG